MPNSPEIPVDPALAAAAEQRRARPRSRTPDVKCQKCEYVGRSNAEIAEHLIEVHPTGVFGPDKQEAYLELLINGEGRHTGARKVKVSPATVAKFISLNPPFERAVRMAEEEYVEKIEQRLYEAALNAEPWAVKEALSKRSPKRWGPIPQEVNINQTLEVKHELDASPQMQRVAQIMANLQARAALGAVSDIIDAEVVEDV